MAEPAAAAGRVHPARHPGDVSTDPRHSSPRTRPPPDVRPVLAVARAARARRGRRRGGWCASFADTVRREYLAVGLRVSLHPQADLATEPRWARTPGTFGEDADIAFRAGSPGPYLRGLRGPADAPGARLTRQSIACCRQALPRRRPAEGTGRIPHFPYGREQVYPGGMFDYHLRSVPRRDRGRRHPDHALLRHAGRHRGYEQVAFGFNKQILPTGLLLGTNSGFDGIVLL